MRVDSFTGRVFELKLAGNNLVGTIPAELGDMIALTHLDLSNNQLSGALPEELGKLTRLEYLALHNNQLSGAIPAGVGDMTKLQELLLQNNQLSGMIPTEFGNLTRLQDLGLSNNALSGTIPAALGNLTLLTQLDLSNNALVGTIPAALGDLTLLTQLDLSNNALVGTIPAELVDLTLLTHFALHSNQLSGTIPAALGDMDALTHLYLHNNQLSGTIPAALGDMDALTELWLRNNQLSGAIPAELANVGEKLYLQNNAALSGAIPSSFVASTTILQLHVQNTQVTVPPAVQTWAEADVLRFLTTGTQESHSTFSLDAANTAPAGLWSDGTTLYVLDSAAHKVFAYILDTGVRAADKDINLDTTDTAPFGLWSDGTTLWVTSDGLRLDDDLFAYTLATGLRDADKDEELDGLEFSGTLFGNYAPLGLWGDATCLWVVNGKYPDPGVSIQSSVYAYDRPTTTCSGSGFYLQHNTYGGLWGNGTTFWVVDREGLRLTAYTLADSTRDRTNYRILAPENTSRAVSGCRPTAGAGDGGCRTPARKRYTTILSMNFRCSRTARARHGHLRRLRATQRRDPPALSARRWRPPMPTRRIP